jgi:hypothetical protein
MLGGSPPPDVAPEIVTTAFAHGYVGSPYSRGMVVTGTLPMTYAVIAGTLPDGLDIDADTGVISGTPTTEEVQSGVEIEVTNVAGTDSAIYTFTIEAAQTTGLRLCGTFVGSVTVIYGDSVGTGEIGGE